MEDDEVTLSLDGKNLGNLRVVDLKLELEKRGLSKSGSKKSLVKRLKTQLEFEKLCVERKTGDCDLKKELDAATEQNEFVQRYLAQQQKILAEQKEVKRLVELEENQKRNEENEGLSPGVEENQSTEESDTEEDDDNDTNDSNKKTTKIESKEKACLEIDKKSVSAEQVEKECLSKSKNVDIDNNIQSTIENENLVQKSVSEKTESTEKEATDKISKKEDTFDSPKNVNKADTPVKSSTSENEPFCEKKPNLSLTLKISNDGYTSSVKGNDEKSTSLITEKKSCKSAINTTTEDVVVTDQSDKICEPKPDAIPNVEQSKSNQSDKLNLNIVDSGATIDVSDIPFPPDSNLEKCALEKKEENDSLSSIPCEKEVSLLKGDDSTDLSKTVASPTITGISTSLLAETSVVDPNKSERKMDQNVPYSLSEIKLPESSTNVETSEKIVSQKETLSPGIVKEEEVSESCVNPDHNSQSNGVSSLKETEECFKNDLATNKSSIDKDKISKDLKQNSLKLEKKKSTGKELKVQVKSKNKSLESKSSLKSSIESKNSSKSEGKSRKKEPVKKYDSSESDKESNSGSSSSSDESSRSEEDNRKRSSRRKGSPKVTRRKRESSTDSRSSESRTSSPEKSSSPENKKNKKDFKRSASPEITKNSKSPEHPEVLSNVLEANTIGSKDPPRKKLKINRNNVIIPSVPEDSSEVPNSLKSPKTVPEKSTKALGEKSSSEEHHEPDSPQLSSEETVEREMGEIIENYPEIKYEPRKLNFPGRKLSRKSTDDPTSEEMSKTKKSKWGKFATTRKSSQTINISTDSLKNWFPDFKLVNEPVPVTEVPQEDSPLVKDDKKSNFTLNIENDIDINQDKNKTQNTVHNVPEPSSIENTEPSTPVSKIVFIQNLVRPFTLLQLKEFLRQNGNLSEEKFWIDKIKSKCFATYETEEEAVKSRNAINGTRWPASNPKILSAEFSTEEEFELHRSGADVQKVTLDSLPPVQESYESKTSQSAHTADHRKREADKRRERERYRMQAPMREWDKDKLLQESPERNAIGKDSDGHRLSDKKDRKDPKKKSNEDTPAKLLDDLFQKTKSVPCIYWLPLTEIQVAEREEALRQRKLEREKRQQQREQEDSEHRKRPRTDHKSRDAESRRSSTRSRSPTSRRR